MTNHSIDSYLSQPSFLEAINNFQNGEWEAGLQQLDELRKLYPLDDELRSLRQEMQLKSKIDEYEELEKKTVRNRFVKKYAIRSIITITLLGLMLAGGLFYSSWIQEQLNSAQQRIQNEALAIDLSIRFRNAQNLLLAGRPAEAKVIFEEVELLSPDFPELSYYLSETEALLILDKKYLEAVTLLNQGDTQTALILFKEIGAQKPLYKDISLQIDNIERGYLLEDLQEQANAYFQGKNWEAAISAYASILALHPTENLHEIEQQLFLSYIYAAETILDDPVGTIEALESAEDYFKKALVLRPQNNDVLERWAEARETIKVRLINSYIEQALLVLADRADSLEALGESVIYLDKALELDPNDQRIKNQTNFAKNYLQAIEAYRKNIWTQVIDLLEPIIEEDSQFANGAASQTLYEAYIARGNDFFVGGLFEEALLDYQRAAVIAKKNPDSTLLIIEAQIKAAQAHRLLFNFEASVAIYQSAVALLESETNFFQENPEWVSLVAEANLLASQANFRSAYLIYEDMLDDNNIIYENTITHIVQAEEYLTLIANRYNTTVQAIVEANGISDPNKIIVGQELTIPILK